jgi:PhnB protein
MAENDDRQEAIETSIAPWLSVGDAARAVDYYKAAFGAVEHYRLEDDAGRLVVARLAVGAADFWVQEDPEATPETCVRNIHMVLTVQDPEAVYREALDAGGIEITPVSAAHGWLIGRLRDPVGHQWEVGRPLMSSDGRE